VTGGCGVEEPIGPAGTAVRRDANAVYSLGRSEERASGCCARPTS
jgi:hypothetical protein